MFCAVSPCFSRISWFLVQINFLVVYIFMVCRVETYFKFFVGQKKYCNILMERKLDLINDFHFCQPLWLKTYFQLMYSYCWIFFRNIQVMFCFQRNSFYLGFSNESLVGLETFLIVRTISGFHFIFIINRGWVWFTIL